MWTNVLAWNREQWMGAASHESAAAAPRAGFLFFWYLISERTLAALFMWAHRGWGHPPYDQRPPVDASSVHVLSTAVWHHVLAQLRRQDERPIEQLAVEAHLCVTQRLLGSFPQYDGEISLPKFCQDCLWQHLANSVARRPDGQAFQWFVDHQPEQFACTEHLEELNKILKRLEDPEPEVDAVEEEPSRLEVFSNLLKFKPWVFPLQSHLLLSLITLTGIGVVAVLPSSPPESRVALLTEQLQQPDSTEPVELSFPEPSQATISPPAESPPPEERPRTQSPQPGEAGTPGPQSGAGSTPPSGNRSPPLPIFSTPTPDTPATGPGTPQAPVMAGEPGNGSGTGSGSRTGGTGPTNGGTPPAAEGSQAEMNRLAHDLSVQLQRLGKPCIAAGRRFEPVPGNGLLINGRRPTTQDIPVIRIALTECKE